MKSEVRLAKLGGVAEWTEVGSFLVQRARLKRDLVASVAPLSVAPDWGSTYRKLF